MLRQGLAQDRAATRSESLEVTMFKAKPQLPRPAGQAGGDSALCAHQGAAGDCLRGQPEPRSGLRILVGSLPSQKGHEGQ